MLTQETAETVLAIQMHGLRMHNDLANIGTLFGMAGMARLHKRQLMKETLCFMKTQEKFIGQFGEIPVQHLNWQEGEREPVALPDHELTENEKADIADTMLERWIAHEELALEGYAAAEEQDGDTRLWRALKQGAECEMKEIERLRAMLIKNKG